MVVVLPIQESCPQFVGLIVCEGHCIYVFCFRQRWCLLLTPTIFLFLLVFFDFLFFFSHTLGTSGDGKLKNINVPAFSKSLPFPTLSNKKVLQRKTQFEHFPQIFPISCLSLFILLLNPRPDPNQPELARAGSVWVVTQKC